jgi:lipopolysaccharide/colanic/teichoic acid biosynthesis glycosyltransferase
MSFVDVKEKEAEIVLPAFDEAKPALRSLVSHAAGDAGYIGQRDAAPASLPEAPRGLYARFGKRMLDVFLILVAAPMVLLVCLPMALMIMLDGGSPFYKQARVGRQGKLYTMWKFRTMVQDADVKLQQYLDQNPDAAAEWLHYQKLRNDPRITPVGRILRKTSLDELPQLWNVLKGDMSLVGPRPMMDGQQSLYPGEDYYALRPGITGPWQVSVRNESSFADRAGFDSTYLAEQSLMADVKLLFATVTVVAGGSGH